MSNAWEYRHAFRVHTFEDVPLVGEFEFTSKGPAAT
jgi:hypothetical protein